MLVIRNEQLAAFDVVAQRQALGELRLHARAHFAVLLRDVPDERLELVLRRLVAAARLRGLERMAEVLLFVNLGIVLGEGFLSRPELSWMQQMMNDSSLGSPRQRIRRVHAEAVKRMEPAP